MITLLRVDHRLLHGQVAFSWTQYVGADCILIANDSVPAMSCGKPPPACQTALGEAGD